VSHPNLGLPPRDLTRGFPAAATRLRARGDELAVRSLDIALQRDPTIRDRHDELAMRKLLRDLGTYVERLALCVGSDDPYFLREFADQVAPLYRRRRVSADDAVRLLEGLRAATAGVLAPDERPAADRGIDAAIKVFRDYRRIAGDARRRNPLLAAIYKGG
jgi:hypothetical protein